MRVKKSILIAGIVLLTMACIGMVSACESDCCEPECMGCTPGFWKNHVELWPEDCGTYDPIAPDDILRGDDTYLDALSYGGGPGIEGATKIFYRAYVAAYLNSCAATEDTGWYASPGTILNYLSVLTGNRQSILDVADDLDSDNNRGCPF